MNIRILATVSRYSKAFKLAASLLILLAGVQIQTTQALPILQLDSDFQLHGAKGVLIDGFSYNVRFIDSSCDRIWSGCDNNKFLFKTSEFAMKASQALLDQVFLDLAPHLLFDSVPWTLAGIEPLNEAFVWTPFRNTGSGVSAMTAVNRPMESGDFTGAGAAPVSRDFGSFAASDTWAKWTVTVVPEPSVMLLMASGLIAFGVVRRKAVN